MNFISDYKGISCWLLNKLVSIGLQMFFYDVEAYLSHEEVLKSWWICDHAQRCVGLIVTVIVFSHLLSAAYKMTSGPLHVSLQSR